MIYLLQGNPKRFAIDDYLARYSYIYWSAPKLAKEIGVGSRIYIWRAGPVAGVVARGEVVESATNLSDVEHPEALGVDLWRSAPDSPMDTKVGVVLDDVRLTVEEGMVLRDVVKNDPVLANSAIIKARTGTVFRLVGDAAARVEGLWSGTLILPSVNDAASNVEGARKEYTHVRRERSRHLVGLKRDQALALRGRLECEACGKSGEDQYPQFPEVNFFEVHHLVPLASLTSTTVTKVDDLALLCANCHRVVHSSKSVEANFQKLIEKR